MNQLVVLRDKNGKLIISTYIVEHYKLSYFTLKRILVQDNKNPKTKHGDFSLQRILVQKKDFLFR